jgi:hypothetical protein
MAIGKGECEAALLRLAGELLHFWPEGAPDGADLQDMLLAHGLIEETVATAEDAAQEWAQVEAGDWCFKLTALGRRALTAATTEEDPPCPT